MNVKKLLMNLFLVTICFSCSNKDTDELIVGSIRPKSIQRNLPEIPMTKSEATARSGLVTAYDLELFQNKESFPKLMTMIQNSKKYFYMNVLSFTCDEVTEPMVKLLEARAKEKVDVRLIVNKGFSYVSLPCLGRLKKSGVQILKNKTHSSYFLNDQSELLIGSQSVARMFFLADGFNSLDRDMMLYARGDVATDAFHDFISIWHQDSNVLDLKELRSDLAQYTEYKKIKVNTPSKSGPSQCRFLSERPSLGIKDYQDFLLQEIALNQKELIFSGVKVETRDGAIGAMIKKKSLEGMETHYIGNGLLSGNGELSMVLEEWGPWFSGINDWDKKRSARNNQILYDDLKKNSKINVWAYFNFIHHKVWLFDAPGFLIGSANLDESKFGVVYEAGLYCQNAQVHHSLKRELYRDRNNSELYQ